MEKYVDAGRRITYKQYEEVLYGVRGDLGLWMKLIKYGVKGSFFDVRSSTQFLYSVGDKKELAYALEMASIITNNPTKMDTVS